RSPQDSPCVSPPQETRMRALAARSQPGGPSAGAAPVAAEPKPASNPCLRWDAYQRDGASQALLQEIGLLRRRGYAAAGKIDPCGGPMVDALDWEPHVHHLVWRDDRGRAVAAVRLTCPHTKAQRFDVVREDGWLLPAPRRSW